MEKIFASIVELVPTLRQVTAEEASLEERLAQLKGDDDNCLAARPVHEQVTFLRASSLVHMSGVYIGSARTNFAHCPAAFAMIKGEMDPGLVEHALASVADEVAFAPDQGVLPEAAILASLVSIQFDLDLAKQHLASASTLLAQLAG